jgi:RNA polymerase sigma-70 factor (ECF subfamily)
MSRRGVLSEDDFATRFQEGARFLWCIAYGILMDRNLAEDAVQEAALVGLRKLKQFDPDTEFKAWMGQIVRFSALNMARRKKRQRASADALELIEADTHSSHLHPHAIISGKGQLFSDIESFDDQTRAALLRLESDARACLLLRTVEDYSYRKIGETLNMAEGTVMSHVHRARKRMRSWLTETSTKEATV